MCGIVGFTGKRNAKEILLEGLYALEYRGYDSAGIAVCESDGNIDVIKCQGRISALEDRISDGSLNGNCGIAHTRWATHGRPSEANAHPHESDTVVLVHNGIIDNYRELKKELENEGYTFSSETDTEVIAHLIDREYRLTGNPPQAIFKATRFLRGAYALGIMFRDRKGEIWGIRKDNPLIVGMGEDGAHLASDIPALLHHAREIFRPNEGTAVRLTADEVLLYDGKNLPVEAKFEHVDWEVNSADKEGYPHFMLKEINEEPSAVKRCVDHRIGKDGLPDFSADTIPTGFFSGFDGIEIISCGSATHAGLVGRNLIEALSGVPVTVNTASEYRYQLPASRGNTLVIAISQSGETADTLAALRRAKENGRTAVGIINVFGSAIARESDYVMYTNAGPEIAVATTKGYSTQVALLSMIAARIALEKGKMSEDEARRYCFELANCVPDAIAEIISRRNEIKSMAATVAKSRDLYYIGRGPDYYAGIECSLKLKEISYIHSEAYAAGELKHGTLALIVKDTPVIALCTDERYFDKMTGNIREVKARDCCLLLVCSTRFNQDGELSDETFVLPDVSPCFTPVVSVVLAQLLAYETAVLLGCDVDHPRNLAKSVTVE